MALAWLLNSLSDIVMAGALGGVTVYALRTRAEVRELKRRLDTKNGTVVTWQGGPVTPVTIASGWRWWNR